VIRNLLLSGGPGHDFAQTTEFLVDLLANAAAPEAAEQSLDQQVPAEPIVTQVVTQPEQFFEQLLLANSGKIAQWDLLTVNALRWQMLPDRYAPQRKQWAYKIQESQVHLMHDFVAQGGGLVALHSAVICFDAHPVWHQLTGATWDWSRSSHPDLAEFKVTVTAEGLDHPVTSAAANFCITDELYKFLDQVSDLAPLLTSSYLGVDHPLLWAHSVGRGRVVTDLLGHSVDSLTNAAHSKILVRAACWAARDPERLVTDLARNNS